VRYRLYEIRAGRLSNEPITVEADTDQAAIEKASKLLVRYDGELWYNARLVARLSGGADVPR
jgi:hypothetical protein